MNEFTNISEVASVEGMHMFNDDYFLFMRDMII